MSDFKIETKCVQGGYTPANGEPRQIPIIQSTTFKYATSEDMGKLFDLEASGYFYTACKTPQTIMLPLRFAIWKAARRLCLPLPDRRQASILCLTLLPAVTTLFHPLQSTAEHTIFLQLP